MRILMVHNRYQQPGGEDAVVRAESELLRTNGHAVDLLEEDNDTIAGLPQAFGTALRCVWSVNARRTIRERILDFRPDLVHIHNFFPRLSPSVHFACRQAGVPIVQTLHNYRLLCPSATLLRDGHICEECPAHLYPWAAVRHACYRGSHAASTAVANMLFVHRVFATWSHTVTRFIALSEFARAKFTAAGLPPQKIVVKPNFVSKDPGAGSGQGGYALFVGRLSTEKGLLTLLKAWQQLPAQHQLRVVGDGPLAPEVRALASVHPSIQWLGWQNQDQVSALMAEAAVLIFPSIWYEGFPMVLAEAFAAGLPVITSRLGTMAEVVTQGKTGLLFSPGHAEELAAALQWIFAHPQEGASLRRHVRQEFEEKYTAAVNYRKLLAIYQSACRALQQRVPALRSAGVVESAS